MKSNFPKIQFFLSTTLFVLSLISLFFFYKALDGKYRESQLREGEWQKETDRREEIKALDNSVKIIAAERAELETHFAQSSDIVPFLDTIEALAPKVGAKAEVTSVKIMEDHSGLLIGVKAGGSFSSLYKFLTLLENSPYELKFVGMEIQKETESWQAIFQVKLLTFVE